MAESIKELQQKAALKQSLETKLNELYNQRREYDRKAISLRVAFSLEQDDVNKLEERSLRNYFYHAFGMMDEKINRHRQEAQAAKLKLEAGEAELAGIDVDIAEIQSQLAQVRIAQQLLEQAMKDRRSELKAAGTEAITTIITNFCLGFSFKLTFPLNISATREKKPVIKSKISLAVAPPIFTIKFACFSETIAFPMQKPFNPACSIS